MQRRKWVPDPALIADQLIEDYRAESDERGFLDGVSTITSWQATAQTHGEELIEDDWVALVLELARRAARGADV
jgi:hypothetical protein